jgi:hypothetical protein
MTKNRAVASTHATRPTLRCMLECGTSVAESADGLRVASPQRDGDLELPIAAATQVAKAHGAGTALPP